MERLVLSRGGSFCVQLVGFVLLRTILSGEAQWHRFLYALVFDFNFRPAHGV